MKIKLENISAKFFGVFSFMEFFVGFPNKKKKKKRLRPLSGPSWSRLCPGKKIKAPFGAFLV